jgi:putative transcription factor
VKPSPRASVVPLKTGLNARKLEDENEELPHAKVTHALRLAISKGKQAKGMTQKDLSRRLSVAPQLISEYESGKGIPNNATIALLERTLGVKLPRV